MNIMVPIQNESLVNELVQAGTDEFYFGFKDSKWERRFGTFSEINRMSSFGSRANFDFNKIESLISEIHHYNKKVFATLNSSTYSKDEKKYILKYIDFLCRNDVDGIIVGDASLIEEIKKRNGFPVLSTMAGVYNSAIVEFYKQLGIKRIILPRDISIDNIESIVRNNKDIEFELFLMRNGCKYSDSQCSMYHGRTFGSMCSCIDKADNTMIFSEHVSKEFKHEILNNNEKYRTMYHKNACGLCFLNRMMDMGVKSVKIVGRNDNSKDVIQDVKRVKHYISLLENGDLCDIEKNDKCNEGYNCYY